MYKRQDLNRIIREAVPAKVRAVGGHPSKKTFQAIRSELNQELEVLSNSIDQMIDLLNPGGRLSIITFHSLEAVSYTHLNNCCKTFGCIPRSIARVA